MMMMITMIMMMRRFSQLVLGAATAVTDERL